MADIRSAFPAKLIKAKDGRTLAYVEVGDSHGPLVVHKHGGPSSRYEALLFAETAAKHGLRMIGVDRPGFGQSSPQSLRTYAGWCDDLTTIADALGQDTFAVTGWSEGGPWALAAAACLDPARLRHVTSIARASRGAFGDDSAEPCAMARAIDRVESGATGQSRACHGAGPFR